MLVALAAACADGSSREDYGNDAAVTPTEGGALPPTPGDDAGFGSNDSGASSGNVPTGPAEVFAHSADTLYKLDPDSNEVTRVGAFTGTSGEAIVDLALNEAGEMYGCSYDSLYRFDKSNAAGTKLRSAPSNQKYPNSLSFVPKGTIEDDQEVLVGYFDADYIRIDTTTGAIRSVTADALPDGLVSSGDIVSIKGGDFLTYLTVKATNACRNGQPCKACENVDCVVRVDPVTGIPMGSFLPAKYTKIFGLAFWAGAVYGINEGGKLFSIEVSNTRADVTDIPIPNSVGSAIKFYGAGSTTAAPAGPN